ncbi:MAG: hypothetical protein WBQ43_12115 [Terriglobales bacterium]
MTVGSISAASLSQYVLSSSQSNPLQQAMESLQDSLASGDLNGAQAAFQTLQNLNQSLENASGNSASSYTQLSTDMTTLGSALSSGDLSTAQTAFSAVESDLKSSNSPSLTNEMNAASQSVQMVQQLLIPLNENGSSSSSSDNMTSVLERVYGSTGGLNVLA